MNYVAAAFILAYGIMACAAALTVAAIGGSPTGAALVFAAAGLIYIFQVMDLMGAAPRAQVLLPLVAVAALLLSIAVSLGAFDHVS